MDVLVESGDLAITNNDLVQIEGPNETKQRIEQRLQMFFSEWFLDRRKGIPYIQDILRKSAQQSTISAILKKEIIDVLGVDELLAFEMDYVTVSRTLTINLSIRSYENIVSLSITLS